MPADWSPFHCPRLPVDVRISLQRGRGASFPAESMRRRLIAVERRSLPLLVLIFPDFIHESFNFESYDLSVLQSTGRSCCLREVLCSRTTSARTHG